MNARFFAPTDVRWTDWYLVRDFFPTISQRILIATSNSSLSRAETIRDSLLERHHTSVLPSIGADPTAASVQETTEQIVSEAPDWIIAIGGGSVLDTAKAAAVAAKNNGNIHKLIRGCIPISSPGIPLIAIPTTSGSGSEVTPYASITDASLSNKVSLSHDFLFPKIAILDPSLTLSLSKQQTAISGMDALSHSIEGYWSNLATPPTDALALSAAKLLMEQLIITQQSPHNLTARRMTMEGSMLAGLTISNARTTAVHSVSYPLTVFYGVPHGLACSLLLPSMIRYNGGFIPREKEHQLLKTIGCTSMNELADLVERLQIALGLPSKLTGVGIGKGDIPKIIENGFRPDRVANNPRKLTVKDLKALLEALL